MTTIDFNYALGQMTQTLRPFAVKLTRDHEEANDLVQETMFKAFKNRKKFADGTNLKAWMYTIMKNTFITNYQKMARRGTFVDTTENMHFINSTDSKIENQAYGDFTMDDINTAIDTLNSVYRIPFMMHFRGFKYHEIAEQLSIPIGTVKNRIHIARKLLQQGLRIYRVTA